MVVVEAVPSEEGKVYELWDRVADLFMEFWKWVVGAVVLIIVIVVAAVVMGSGSGSSSTTAVKPLPTKADCAVATKTVTVFTTTYTPPQVSGTVAKQYQKDFATLEQSCPPALVGAFETQILAPWFKKGNFPAPLPSSPKPTGTIKLPPICATKAGADLPYCHVPTTTKP